MDAGRHQYVMASICSLGFLSHGAQLPWKGKKKADGYTDLVVEIAGYCSTAQREKGTEKAGR